MNDEPPQYEFEVLMRVDDSSVTRRVKGEAMACLNGCLIIFAGAPILCLAAGTWYSAERVWPMEVEEGDGKQV